MSNEPTQVDEPRELSTHDQVSIALLTQSVATISLTLISMNSKMDAQAAESRENKIELAKITGGKATLMWGLSMLGMVWIVMSGAAENVGIVVGKIFGGAR